MPYILGHPILGYPIYKYRVASTSATSGFLAYVLKNLYRFDLTRTEERTPKYHNLCDNAIKVSEPVLSIILKECNILDLSLTSVGSPSITFTTSQGRTVLQVSIYYLSYHLICFQKSAFLTTTSAFQKNGHRWPPTKHQIFKLEGTCTHHQIHL